jgi:hypothetical protein
MRRARDGASTVQAVMAGNLAKVSFELPSALLYLTLDR